MDEGEKDRRKKSDTDKRIKKIIEIGRQKKYFSDEEEEKRKMMMTEYDIREVNGLEVI